MSENNITNLEEKGYHLLYEFFTYTEQMHYYQQMYNEFDTVEQFINRLREKGNFANSLIDNNIGKAAIHADPDNVKIILNVINSSTRYSVVSTGEEDSSTGYTKRSVPVDWVKNNSDI